MTTPAPARFYLLPDGTQSSVQMIVGPDGEPRPLAVQTPQQLSDWGKIQDALPPTDVARDIALAVSMVRPLFNDGEIAALRAQAAAEAGTQVAPAEPRTQAEEDARTRAAAELAAAVGLTLVFVPVADAWGNPPHIELRQAGMTYPGGRTLPEIEVTLRTIAQQRARIDAQEAMLNARRAQLAADAAEAVANLPANRIARLEAKLRAAGIDA